MGNVEHIQTKQKMPTFRLDINPHTYQHRVVVGCKTVTVVSGEYDTPVEAAEIMRQLNKRYYG